MIIESYNKAHFSQCVAIFDSNLGKYFAECERKYFTDFLEYHACRLPYFVVLVNDEVVACGGYELEGGCVTLSWGMVKRELHGQGFGSELVEYRLNRISREYSELPVKIDTSQHTQAFYEKQGFAIHKTIKDGYKEGLDKVCMKYSPACH